MLYDCLIVGAGPAGLTAALYTNRAGLSTIVLEKFFVGGQVSNTYEVDNYPGYSQISGPELMQKIEEHSKNHGTNIVFDEVTDISKEGNIFKIKCKKNEYTSKTVIVTTGAKPRLLEVKGESEFKGRGVSYCATCDGAFYKAKDVAVLGSGNTAVEDAIFLARLCRKVYLISRSGRLKAEQRILDRLPDFSNIEVIYNHTCKEITGSNFVEKIIMSNISDNSIREFEVSGVFVAIGITPNSNILADKLSTTNHGYITTNEKMQTEIPGLFAAGDARDTPLRQIITAASDGAIAAYHASLYIAENK